MRVDIFDTAEDRRQVLPLRSDGLRVPWFQCLCKVLVLGLEVDLQLGCPCHVLGLELSASGLCGCLVLLGL